MPRRPSPLPLVLCASTLVALVAGPAGAQQDRRAGMLPPDGQAAFEKAYIPHKAVFSTINKANEGEKASKDNKEHREAIDMAAQYYTYRLTWDSLNGTPGEVDKVMQAFFQEVNNADSDAVRKGNPVFTELFLKALTQRARDVVQTRQQIAAVNAGRMLARLAKAGSEEAGDACLEALQNDKDFLDPKARAGVQYWALQGLGNLLERWAEAPADPSAAPAAGAARKDREAKYVQALVNFLDQFAAKGGTAPAGAGKDPAEERGLQLFRREAVRALAHYRNPAVADEKGNIKVKSALALLKVVANDGLTPPARLDERIEAAIGVARLRVKALPSYQPDYAAQQVGYVVVQMGNDVKPSKPNDPNKFPWKVYAAQLGDALEGMRADAKGAPDKAGEYVDKMVAQSLRILKEGIEVRETATTQGDLKIWLDTTAPPHNSLYKGVADATVRVGGAGEAAPEQPAKPGTKPGDKKPDDKKPAEKKPEEKKPGKP